MIVVSNSGPLIALARIGKIDLLESLFHQVRIPKAVTIEIGGRNKGERTSLYPKSWLKEVCVKDKMALELLRERLGSGESEAIILAFETKADLLLMDEERGRRIASSRQINIIGTMGILILAKQKRLIPAVAPLLEELRARDFRMSDDLAGTVLELARE